MDEKFNDLLKSLNEECLRRSDEDLTLLEDSMSEVLDAWTDYRMSQEEPPTTRVSRMYHFWFDMIERFI